MILTDSEVLKKIEEGKISISPFNREHLGSNSYDVHLAETIFCYQEVCLDAKKAPFPYTQQVMDSEVGYVLAPGKLYLGATQEKSYTTDTVPFLEGKSSIGRLGISIHATAGKGDIGFDNWWTLELSVIVPVRIYPGMPIGQLIFFQAVGDCLVPYKNKTTAKYREQIEAFPAISGMYLNWDAYNKKWK